MKRRQDESFSMLEEYDPTKELAKIKGERRWTNAHVRKHVKEAQQKPKLVDPNREPEIAGVVINVGKRDGRINRFESRFKRDIRQMMEGYSATNLHHYLAYLERRRIKLLKEKLRRLKLAEQEQTEGGQ
jgi:hypothetical protein